MNIIRRISGFYKPYIGRIILGTISIILLTQCDIVNTVIVKKLIDIFSGVGEQIVNKREMQFILNVPVVNWQLIFQGKEKIFLLVVYIGLFALFNMMVKGLFVYGKEYSMNSVNNKVMRDLRQKLYEKLLYRPLGFYDVTQTGDLMAKVTNDVNMLQGTLESFISIITDIVQSFFFVGMMFYYNWQLSLFVLGMFPITGYIVKRFSKPIRKASQKIAENISYISSFLQETLTGIKVIKIFTKESYENDRFRSLTQSTYARNMKAVKLIAYMKPISELLSIVGVIGVIFFAGYQMITGGITLGEFGRYIVLATMAYKPLKGLGNINATMQKAMASGDRIFHLMDQETEKQIEKKHIKQTRTLDKVKGDIEFKSLWFEYKKGVPVLRNVSIKVSSGKVIALVGPSGGGKTTFVNLIPRFYEIKKGSIRIDNVDIRDISIDNLRRNIGMVPQETFLFSGTVEDNIAYGRKDAPVEKIMESARHANAHDFIIKLKEGYKTQIGERGVQLSGGQKQRISIARALLKDPKILILDEATSALDTESEILVQKALSFLMKGRTTFIIAHRLSTVRNADQIIVIDKGRIAQQGKHKTLIKNKKGLYYKLCKSQEIMNL
ncbi:MAG: ABC transporter ATP-binding protein [Spirochaetes bacterium]|nr:ABC transporter ATP-binding protein [Spirochaetota bacterium]